MQRDAIHAHEDKVRLLSGLLRSWGHDADDFEIEEDQTSELADLFGLTGGIVCVRRRSTGEERLYATGFGSAWFGSLLMDLARGRFPPPARRQRPRARERRA
jgi:hypothetical protein